VPSSEGPLLHRRRLGAELRRLRGDRTLEEVAEATLISTSKLSRLENGQGVPQPRDIRDLVNFYGLAAQAADRLRRWASAGRSQAWWQEYSDALEGITTYVDYESGASTIRGFAAAIVPPLLQTDAYAVELYKVLPSIKSDEAARKVLEVRARRQQLLVESDDAAQLIFVLDEAVLHRTFGSPDDVREQLDRLLDVSRQRHISLRVLPFGAGMHAGMLGLFTILQYADDRDRDVVFIESYTGERLHEQPSSVLEYLRIFDAVTRKALDHDGSRGLIAEIRDRISHPSKGRP
jgi:transcriptional regulator with XRE-family HTH domain